MYNFLNILMSIKIFSLLEYYGSPFFIFSFPAPGTVGYLENAFDDYRYT